MSTLSPTQHAKLRSLVEGFDAAIERERALGGAPSAEQMRARGVDLADVNARLDRGISLRDVHALAERGLLEVATARTSASGLRRGSFGRWLGGSVQHELVTARVTPTEEARRQIAATEVAIMADQLWVVFVDGVAQTGILPFAGSEEIALRLWREQTGQREFARERLRAVPKADERAATARSIVRAIAYMLVAEEESVSGGDFFEEVSFKLDKAGFLAEARAASRPLFRSVPNKDPALAIVQNMALRLRDPDAAINGGDFLDYVTRALDKAGFLAEARASAEAERGVHEPAVADSSGAIGRWALVPSHRPEELTAEEIEAALRAWANEHGRTWKAALRDAWYSGNYGGSEHDAALQRIRNTLGPSWLVNYRLPVNPSQETTGYRCWVRTSIEPNDTRVWVATRRQDAVSQVRAAVRNNNSEGGVESKDPDKPFERTFAMEGGKLITTKHTD